MKRKLASILCVLTVIAAFQLTKHKWSNARMNSQVPTSVVQSKKGAGESAALAKTDPSIRLKAVENYGKLPIAFEENLGQTDLRVRFLARSAGYSLLLTANQAVLSFTGGGGNTEQAQHRRSGLERAAITNYLSNSKSEQVTLKLIGSDTHVRVNGMDELVTKSNYLVGSNPEKWHTNIANYSKVKYTGIYPGVDLVYYGNNGQLEYDFLIRSGVDPSKIRFNAFADSLAKGSRGATPQLSAAGDLVIGTDGRSVVLRKPVAYQTDNSGCKKYIEARYILDPITSEVGFSVESYDRSRALIIDPVLSYSTYLGPSGGIYAIAVDASGNAYVTGGNTRTGFPTTSGAFQTSCTGSCSNYGASFISKFNSTGSALLYSTYLGGTLGLTFGNSIAVDSAGDAYVTGETSASDFPTTPGAFQTVCHTRTPYTTGFVTKLNSTGSGLVYSTFLGGSVRDSVAGIALDASGEAYVTGGTGSSDFPITAGSFQTTYQSGNGDAFVAKLNSAGSALIYSTYLGGTSAGVRIAINSAGNAYVVGGTQSPSFPTTPGAYATTCNKCGSGTDSSGHPLQSSFVTELNTGASALVYSTFIGGSDANVPEGIALDSSGNAYITGTTYSNDYPTTPGVFQTSCGGGSCSGQAGDMFLSKLNATGSALIYSTYVGGSSYDIGTSIVVDGSGNAYVGGYTESLNFPVTPDAFQSACTNCTTNNGDAFLAEVNSSGSSLLYATYLGGSQKVQEDAAQGIALDSSGNIYLAGQALSTNFPTTTGVFQPTASSSTIGAFVAKFTFGPPAAVVTPSNLSFGSTLVGITTSSQSITLDNSGTGTLTIASVVMSGTNSSDFNQTNNCGTGIAAGASCTVNVTFTPSATGTRSASLVITDNATGSPQSIALSGTATDFSIGAASGGSTSATVTAGQTATYNLQVNALSGFTSSVIVSCTGAPTQSTCTSSTSSVNVTGASSPFTITVSTTGRSFVPPVINRPGPPLLTVPLAVLLVVLVLIYLVDGVSRGIRRRFAWVYAGLLLACVASIAAGCGAGGNSHGGTPAGTYTLTITGGDQSIPMGTPGPRLRTLTLTLTVN